MGEGLDAILGFLADQPLALLFILLALGSALGSVRVLGVQAGPAAVLFVAIGLAAIAHGQGEELAIPVEVGTLGLVLFAYTVGAIAGPGFLSAVRTGWGPIASVAAAIVVAAGVALGLGRALDLPSPVVAGTFAGALTNTPALAAATERAGDAAGPTVGYSIAYVIGVLAMLAATASILRSRARDDDAPPRLENRTIRVERRDAPRIADVVAGQDGQVTFSRLRQAGTDAVLVPDPEDVLRPDDLVTVVGPAPVVRALARELGHTSSHTLPEDRGEVDFRRITLSRRALAGRTIAGLELGTRFGATVTRVRRGDVDVLATDDLLVQPGDRLRVIAPRERMGEISAYLGDSERGLSDINPVGLATGLALGVLVGTISLPLPGGPTEIGAAGGALLAGLVLGRLGRIGPLVTALPHTAASALSQFGMLTFLAYAGTRAGAVVVDALRSNLGWRIAVTGAAIAAVLALAVPIGGRLLHGIGSRRLAGIAAGAQTQPAVLAYANERTGHDARVSLGYALVFPAAMIVKIIAAGLLAGSG